MTPNLKAMIKRKELIRKGTPEAEEQAERILDAVEQAGGLTTEEVYSLQAY
jgi:protein involved in polysaccharide export with SLBB domain